MKNKIILSLIVSMLMSAVPLAAQKSKIFESAKNLKDVTTIYVSPSLLKLGLSTAAMTESMGEAAGYVKNLKGLEVINTSLRQSADSLRSVTRHFVKDSKDAINLLLEINDDDSLINIFGNLDKGDDTTLILEVNDDGEYSIIYLKGDIDVEGLLKSYANKNL